jgi:hypothetical protein
VNRRIGDTGKIQTRESLIRVLQFGPRPERVRSFPMVANEKCRAVISVLLPTWDVGRFLVPSVANRVELT